MKASELINTAIDDLHGPTPLSTVLLKVKTIAFLIKNQQLKEWVDLELKGYEAGVEIPNYRTVFVPPHGMLLHSHYSINKASQDNVLLPLEYLPEKKDKTLASEKSLTSNIIELEEWAQSKEGGRVEMNVLMKNYINNHIYKHSEWNLYKAWQDLTPALFKGVLLIIRTRLLDLLHSLSEWDEVSLQSLQQKQAINETVSKALNSTVNIHGGNVNFSQGDGTVQAANSGAAAQLNTAGDYATQTATPTQVASLKDIVKQIKATIVQEPDFKEYREEMAQELERIEVQLQKPEPKKGIMKRAIESLQDLAVKGAGIATGHAVYELLKQAHNFLPI